LVDYDEAHSCDLPALSENYRKRNRRTIMNRNERNERMDGNDAQQIAASLTAEIKRLRGLLNQIEAWGARRRILPSLCAADWTTFEAILDKVEIRHTFTTSEYEDWIR